MRVEVQRPDGTPARPDEIGEIKVWRHDAWFPTKDRGRIDADGYFYHAGRADDVIISAGWTIGAVEVEDTLLKHPAVREAAVIGVPDATRGQVVKAFIVTDHAPDPALATEIQDFVRARLSQHEYPRLVAFVAELPKTPAGKVNRKVLRDREPVPASDRNFSMPSETTRHFPKITDQALDALRQRIGRDRSRTPSSPGATRRRATTSVTTRTASATTTRCGAIPTTRRKPDTAPSSRCPSFLFATSRIISGYVGGLPGVHAMWAGADWTWHKPVLRNDTIDTEASLKDLIEHQTRFAGRAIQQIYHVEFFNQHGDLVAEADSWCFRTDRDDAREKGTKYTDLRSQAAGRVHRRAARTDLPALSRRGDPRCDAALLAGRGDRRRAADDGEGPDDGHRLHRLRAGLGRAVHPCQQARLAADARASRDWASRTGSAFPTVPNACTGRKNSR